MKNIKFLLIILFCILSFSLPISAEVEQYVNEDNVEPRSWVYIEHYYGYCSGPQIIRTYDGHVYLPSRLARIEKKLQDIYYDSWLGEFSAPYVIYRYIDINGNVTIPLEEYINDMANLKVSTGKFGVCPGAFWE